MYLRPDMPDSGRIRDVHLLPTGLFGHEARFAFRVFLKIRRFMEYTPKFSDRASIPNLSSSPASPYKLTPVSAHSVRYSLRGWCDHQKCLTLCLWHALLITGVPGLKRFFEKRLAAAIGRSKLFSKDRFSPGTSVISSRNCIGAVESFCFKP